MSLPPERISIKRRRQDEPIDTLVLESGAARDQKRRFTDFFFQRLRHDHIVAATSKTQDIGIASTFAPNKAPRDYKDLGIPTVKTSAPGDEVKDFVRYRDEQQNKSREENEAGTQVQESLLLNSDSSTNPQRQQIVSARRFHLTHDLYSHLRTNPTGGTRRPKFSLRPPLATFVERRSAHQADASDVHMLPPVDSMVEVNEADIVNQNQESLTNNAIGKKTRISTFQKPPAATTKNGSSIRDDPTTWDQDSDQLANELAALAFDIDPVDATEPPKVIPATAPTSSEVSSPQQPTNEPMIIDNDDDFVFETYVRVKHDPMVERLPPCYRTEIGVLVIDNENEDLWEKYVHSDDDDDDWDEEDEDSNAEDNPRNEYPDDEVSTDDEYGRKAYNYRRNTSDDEEFGD